MYDIHIDNIQKLVEGLRERGFNDSQIVQVLDAVQTVRNKPVIKHESQTESHKSGFFAWAFSH